MHIPFACLVKFKFLAHFPVDHLPTQSCLLLYTFSALISSICLLSLLSLLLLSSLLLLFYFLQVFCTCGSWWVFHWSLNDNKPPQVSWMLLKILADLSDAVVWMVFVLLISIPSGLFSKPTTIGITIPLVFHSFYSSLAQSKYFCPVGWGCRILWLLLCGGGTPRPQWAFYYDTKQSDGEFPLMLDLWGKRSTPLLPSGSEWWHLIRVLSMG